MSKQKEINEMHSFFERYDDDKCCLTIGIPLRREKKTPVQAVASIVSTAPIFELVFFPYTAPNVNVGAITVMNMIQQQSFDYKWSFLSTNVFLQCTSARL